MARRPRREINVFSLSFLDLISGALGAVIILYVAVPKAKPNQSELDEAKKTIAAQTERVKELQDQVSQLQSASADTKRLAEENEQLRQQLAQSASASPALSEQKAADVGFNFKGKHIVFVIDTSRSMLDEDRMGQVKAGLKMLVTSMPNDYYVDIVQFPNGMRTPFRSLFGKTQKLGSAVKGEVFDFLYGLKPLGGTPTRDVMNYVFATYRDLTDIVLLTDGEPSLHNSSVKDDIHDLLSSIRRLNQGTRVQINTIGVGEEILHDKSGRPYQFLHLLAEQNAGFFVGF